METILYYIAVITLNGVCTITSFYFLLSFFKLKEKYHNKTVILCTIFYFVSIIIQIPNSFISYKSFVWVTPVYFIFQIAFVTKIFEGSFIYKMMLFFADKITDVVYASLFYLVVNALHEAGVDVNTTVNVYGGLENFKLICYIANAIFIIPLKYLTVKAIKLIIANVLKFKNIAFLLVPISQIALFSAFLITDKSGTSVDPVGTISIAAIGAVIGIIGFILMILNYQDLRKKTVLEQQLYYADKTQEELFRSIDIFAEAQKQQNMFNHDYKNQLNTVLMLIKNQEYDKTENFIESLLESVNEGDKTTYCVNPIVNATVTYKALVAKEKNIKFNSDIIIPEEIDEISEMDLCSLFSNPIDNAIEANEKLPEKERYINISARCDKTMLVIKTENPAVESVEIKKGILPSTTKADKKNHGLGLMIIKEIAEKSGGFADIKYENGVVKVTIRILLNELKA